MTAPGTAPIRPDARRTEAAPSSGDALRSQGITITPGRAYGFFTDTTLCIGCKACEVACKQWNQLPADGFHMSGTSYDNTRGLSATTWRHVLFIEQFDDDRRGGVPPGADPAAPAREPENAAAAGRGAQHADDPAGHDPAGGGDDLGDVAAGWDLAARLEPWANLTTSEEWARPGNRWLLMSDVCKHCVHAPCMEACPTGSIIRTEFDSVYVQQDVCNGCGYCQSACPFGVVEVDRAGTGKAHKCTLCYDRLRDGLEPACAASCPTDSIQFGPVDELLERARLRVGALRERGIPAYLYGSGGVLEDDCDTSALGGLNCFFLLIDRPEVYNLPPIALRPSTSSAKGLAAGGLAALALVGAALAAFVAERSGS